MCSICTGRCDLRSNHRLKSFVASCRGRGVEGKDRNPHYFVLCGLTGLVLGEISKVNARAVPKRAPLAAAVKLADGL